MAGASFNRVILVGRLTKDPETKNTQSGAQLANFGIAVDNPFAKDGKKANFFNVTAWNKLAEICEQYLKKGKLILVEGRLQNDTWEDRETGKPRTRTGIVASVIQMLEKKGGIEAPRWNDDHGMDTDPIEVDEFDAEDMPF